MKKPKVFTGPFKEDGMRTMEAIAALNRYGCYDIALEDGDTVTITGYRAELLVMMRDRFVNRSNRDRMNEMDVLQLLWIYTEGVKDGMITEPKMKEFKR